MTIEQIADEKLGRIRERGTYRTLRELSGAHGPRVMLNGKEVLLFAGSNYLDLSHHPEVVEAAAQAARDYGCAAGGSRLISGNLDLHEAFEAELAAFAGCESALLFNSGYAANLGLIPALVGENDFVVSDQLNHASIIDGVRLSRAQRRVFPHGDCAALDKVLSEVCREGVRVLVPLDGVFSMDGDIAPLRTMVRLAHHHGAMVLLDDAHGTGTLGDGGRGSAAHCGVMDEVDIHLGNLAKGLGSFGAFVAGPAALRDLLINVARSFIFTCALPPPQVGAGRAALRLVRDEPWRRWRLQGNAARLRAKLAAAGIDTAPSATHIVPVVLGDNARTMTVCEALLDEGFYVQGIRHPSVPRGTARLRITPMATHSEEEIDALANAVVRTVERHPAPDA
ncbi:MAG: 8-amino-7-oxononanoate synthase [Myxococcota bacterium]|jgi:glycine C-acetyltransferase|nr:8-amino-7-oxononanoate synthase [Myxococcota bacterium]